MYKKFKITESFNVYQKIIIKESLDTYIKRSESLDTYIKRSESLDRVGYLRASDSPLLLEEVRPSKWRSTERNGNGHSGVNRADPQLPQPALDSSELKMGIYPKCMVTVLVTTLCPHTMAPK
ncbi:hypothetical protein CEXT_159061 [Caerostris extrusa]|uniref:Uncharacterized protein n=1 Tax=Caerostris extrusa TaxID=172846 RepID=A0AAV4XQ32_CAEEX|nr:hypothetical protein CEXT_159061 [Caerostris extrusa]